MGTIPNSKTVQLRRTFEDDKHHVLFIDNVHCLVHVTPWWNVHLCSGFKKNGNILVLK